MTGDAVLAYQVQPWVPIWITISTPVSDTADDWGIVSQFETFGKPSKTSYPFAN